jgi:CRISPR-associated endonuclease Cas1
MNNPQLIIPERKIIAGHGSHIKATRDMLKIQHQGKSSEISLADLDHLMIIGGHNIQTSAITTLMNNNIFISFFESDGEPSGYIKPYGYKGQEEIQKIQDIAPPFSYALAFAKSAVRERLLAIEQWNEDTQNGLLFSGELEILTRAAHELDNFIKIEEILRIDRLIGDMYYEIMSRIIPLEFDYKRRTNRPYRDPVNVILSLGYALLAGDFTRSLVGVHLDPDHGMLNRGKRSLSLDFSNCFKTRMVDAPAIRLLKSGDIKPGHYDCGGKRCILADSLIKRLVSLYQESIRPEIITIQVETFVNALSGKTEFEIHRF